MRSLLSEREKLAGVAIESRKSKWNKRGWIASSNLWRAHLTHHAASTFQRIDWGFRGPFQWRSSKWQQYTVLCPHIQVKPQVIIMQISLQRDSKWIYVNIGNQSSAVFAQLLWLHYVAAKQLKWVFARCSK